MRKVLIITYSFPPLNNIAARRFGELSKYLERHGWEPYILTTNNSGSLEVSLAEENIFRVGTHPQKNNEIKKEKEVGAKELLIRFKRDQGFNLRLLDRTYFNWYKKIVNMDWKSLNKINFDIIIASFGPGAALYAGRYLSKKLGVPWIADFRDLGSLYQDSNFKRNVFFNILDRYLEKEILKSASAIFTVSKGLKEEIESYYQLPTHVIYNGWDKEEEPSKLQSIKDPNYIYYAGRFYYHRMQSIFILLNSMNKTGFDLKIRSLGPEHLNEEIKKHAANVGVSKKLHLLPPVDPTLVESEARNASINLVLEDLDKSYTWKRGTLTGKFLSLLTKEPPVLAIARNDSEIGDILNETGKGALCSTSNEIEEFFLDIDKFYKTKNVYMDKINFYSKETQAMLLAQLLNKYKKKP